MRKRKGVEVIWEKKRERGGNGKLNRRKLGKEREGE